MLQVTARTDYGVLLMVALAQNWEQGPISLRSLAEKKRLPYRFLTQIVLPLRHGGLLEAKEGVTGGYSLTRPPQDIRVGEIVRALEGDVALVRCLKHDEKMCLSEGYCSLPPFWQRVGDHMREYLNSLSLAQLADEQSHIEHPDHTHAAAA